jgi:hypothetical protein
VHWRIHDGIVFFDILSLWVLAFINVKKCVFGCAMKVYCEERCLVSEVDVV